MQPFQVYARLRPLNSREIQQGQAKTSVRLINNTTLAVGENQYRENIFQVDRIFEESTDNQAIFQEYIKPVVDNFLSGINSTILAYGITGAGKSHTMFGTHSTNQPGLIQQTIRYICSHDSPLHPQKLSLSYMQIYNQQVLDLLCAKSQPLQIIDDPVLGTTIPDLQQKIISSHTTAQMLIQLGNTRRIVAQTKANQFSSRSHAIVQINLERCQDNQIVCAKLALVDLAGSEKQNVYAEHKGIRNLEGSNINRSLLTLGNCITALSEKRKGCHVPYRDSKLTRILKDSLGGNTKTAMIACISSSILSYEQTLNTLKYTCRARKIQKNVIQNIKENKSNDELRKQITRLKRQLQRGSSSCPITREQFIQFTHNLIKNVQQLTTLRMTQSTELSLKIQQIELMQQQKCLINNILSSFDHPPLTPLEQTPKSLLSTPKRLKSPSNSFQIEHIITKSSKAHKQDKQNMVFKNIWTIQENTKSQVFTKGNLENARNKHQKDRKIVKELIEEYSQFYHQDQIRRNVIVKVKQLVNNSDLLISSDDQALIDVILQGGQLNTTRFLHSYPPFQVAQVNQNSIELNLPSRRNKQSSNRFLNSLQQIKKMMRKVSEGTMQASNVLLPFQSSHQLQEFNIVQ